MLLVLRLCLKSLFDKLPFKVFQSGASVCTLAAIICLTLMRDNTLLFLAVVTLLLIVNLKSIREEKAADIQSKKEHNFVLFQRCKSSASSSGRKIGIS